MPLYKVATGWGVALLSLVDIVPQPQGGFVAPVVRNESASGVMHNIGAYVPLHWDASIMDEAEYLALLTQFGLHNAETNQATIYCRDGRMQWQRYNGIARLPLPNSEMRWSQFFPRDITILVARLAAL